MAQTVAYVSPNPGCNGNSTCYSSINSALGDVTSGTEIRVEAATYTEDVMLTTNKIVELTGGWAAAYAGQDGTSTIQTLTVEKGSVEIDIVIVQTP